MNSSEIIAVCSRSFSKNEILRKQLNGKYKNVKYNDEGVILEGKNLISFLEGSTKAIVGLEEITETILKELPSLKVISKYGVGTDTLDMIALEKYGVKLGWTPGVNKRSVSELVIAFAIALLRHIKKANLELINGEWSQFVGNELSGKRVGIIGCGNVGKDLVKLLGVFNCKIYSHDIRKYSEFYRKYGVEAVEIEELLINSDIVTIHLPLNNSTKNLLNKDKLMLMGQNAILINLARGGIVDEKALKQMLVKRKIAGAAFDVFEKEPCNDEQLLRLDNFIATPHIGGSSIEAILAMGKAAIEGLENSFIPSSYGQ